MTGRPLTDNEYRLLSRYQHGDPLWLAFTNTERETHQALVTNGLLSNNDGFSQITDQGYTALADHQTAAVGRAR